MTDHCQSRSSMHYRVSRRIHRPVGSRYLVRFDCRFLWRTLCWLPAACCLLGFSPLQAAEPDPADIQFFESRIRPILAENCYKCHSHQAEKLESELYLDSREGVLAGGEIGSIVEPDMPDESRLLVAISYADVDLQMPPKGKLSNEQIADLTEWVKRGIPWPAEASPTATTPYKEGFDLAKRKASHWCWQPVHPTAPPAVRNAAWSQDPIDRFVLARLEENGLEPSPAADRRTLVRRVYFDLVGLPPTPAEVDAFVDDPAANALERVVDRLLASPRFGERWARHWLDLVRYAETRGHEYDYPMPNAYEYRDYVIRAFNADVPYNQFVTEHIAGDLLEDPRRDPTGQINESVLGTGFWFLGEWLHSPVDVRQDEADRIDNQIDVMSKTFLGLTVACARCHDHKFDAIATKDYYALAGYLNSSSYRDVHFQWQDHNRGLVQQLQSLSDATRTKVLRVLGDAQKTALADSGDCLLAARELSRDPQLASESAARIQSAADNRHLNAAVLNHWMDDLNRAKGEPFDPLYPWAVVSQDRGEETPDHLAELLKPIVISWQAEQARATQLPAGASVVVDYAKADANDWIADGLAFGNGPVRPGQVELAADADHPIKGIFDRAQARSGAVSDALPGMFRTPTFTIASPKAWFLVKGSAAAFLCVDSHRMIAGPLHASTKLSVQSEQWSWQGYDVRNYIGERAHIEFTPTAPQGFVAVERVVQSDNAPPAPSRVNSLALKLLTDPAPQSAAELAARYRRLFLETAENLAADRLASLPDAAPRAQLAKWLVHRADWLGYVGAVRDQVKPVLEQHQVERAKLLAQIKGSPMAMAMLDGNAQDECVFIRGSHKNTGDLVPRRPLEAFGGLDQSTPARGSGRLELANRMTDPANPLVARIMVNRVWHHLFGRGIVASVDNFGYLGERPTHPELLDYLADRFVREGWSAKKLIREMVLTSTYQMSSQVTGRGDDLDPDNNLLHRMRIKRLEGEAIRDAILSISGRMDERMYGPGVEVYLTSFLDGRGRPDKSGPLDGDGRRSVYMKLRRNFLPPMMLAFDMPIPFNTIGKRSVSNVPAQALILLNDPFVVEQARLWSSRVLADKGSTPQERIRQMYLAAYAHPPSDTELAAALDFVQQQAEQLGVAPADRLTDRRAWADLAHVLWNVKEFIFVN